MYNNLLYTFEDIAKLAFELGSGSPAYTIVSEILGNWYTENAEGKEFKYYAAAPGDEGAVQLTPEIYYAIEIATSGELDDNEDLSDYTSGYTVVLNEQYKEGGKYSADNAAEWDDAVRAFKNAVVKNNITIYEPDSDGKYYCYYFYWNRHNDNGDNAVMGPMEFATVRNNVYKLRVSKIGEIGKPIIPDNDPDPVDPNDPDEEDKAYIDVQVEILPWVVRVNDIEF